jgi:hypothetical protein
MHSLFSNTFAIRNIPLYHHISQIVDAGKRLEQIQTLKFQRNIEREKSLKLSWKVGQKIFADCFFFKKNSEIIREIIIG